MSINLSPVAGAAAQFLDNNGNVLTGGKLYTYLAGTTTPEVTYTSYSGNIYHTNPIILDAAGRVPGGEVWLSSNLQYKFILKDANDVLIASWDNIAGINNAAFTNTPANYTGNGVTTIFTLPVNPINENWTQVYINGVYQFKSTYSVSNNYLIFSEAPPITSTIEVLY